MENNLKHYGIPGMRWGVRKNSSSSLRKSKKIKDLKKTKMNKLKMSKRLLIASAVITGISLLPLPQSRNYSVAALPRTTAVVIDAVFKD